MRAVTLRGSWPPSCRIGPGPHGTWRAMPASVPQPTGAPDTACRQRRPASPHRCVGCAPYSRVWRQRHGLNNLYSFLLCVDVGDFDFEKVRRLLALSDVNQLPNSAVFLNKGIVAYANRSELGSLHKYPNEVNRGDYGWCFLATISPEEGSVEGANLSFLYAQLISHVSGSHLEPPNTYEYVANNFIFRKSSLVWAHQ